MQAALTTTVRIFERVGLKKNLNKIKAVICTPGLSGDNREITRTNNKPQRVDQPFGKGIEPWYVARSVVRQ